MAFNIVRRTGTSDGDRVLGMQPTYSTVDGALHEVIAADARRRFAQRPRTMNGLDLDKPDVMAGAWR